MFRTKEEEAKLEELALLELVKMTRTLRDNNVKLVSEGGNVVIARIGHWVWAEGEDLKTKPQVRALFKASGYKFSGTRKAWGWSPYKYRGKRSPLALNQLAQKYGYELGKEA